MVISSHFMQKTLTTTIPTKLCVCEWVYKRQNNHDHPPGKWEFGIVRYWNMLREKSTLYLLRTDLRLICSWSRYWKVSLPGTRFDPLLLLPLLFCSAFFFVFFFFGTQHNKQNKTVIMVANDRSHAQILTLSSVTSWCRKSNSTGRICGANFDISGCKCSENCPSAKKLAIRTHGSLSAMPALMMFSITSKYLLQMASEQPSAMTAIQRNAARRCNGLGFCNAGSSNCNNGGISFSGGILIAIKSSVVVAAVAGLLPPSPEKKSSVDQNKF